MGINIFSGFLKKQQSPQNATRLALTLTPNKTIAAIWVLTGENVQILGIAKKSFGNVDALIHESAAAIDTAGKLAKSDVSQTVFGLSSSYFEQKNLSSESLAILKSLAEELDLKAQAYVSLASSISHFLKIRESVTPQAILIGSFGDYTEVHLIRNNQVARTKTSKSEATIEKIIQLVGQIKTEEGQDLPSRIIIYGAVEDSHFGKEITKKEEWKDIFVSTPKIDFLDDDQLAEAIAYSQAADVLGHDPVLIPVGGEADLPKGGSGENIDGQIRLPVKHEETIAANDMGFIEGEDVLEADGKIVEAETKDTASELRNVEAVEEYAVEGDSQKRLIEEQGTAIPATPKKQSLIEKITTISWLPNVFGFIKGSKSRKSLAIILACTLVFLVGGTYIASRTLASVQIIIKANTQVQQGNFKVTAQRGGALDASQNLIPGEEITATADGNQKAVTTGTKNTGDKAKGQITIKNWIIPAITFPKGTAFITKDGVKFTLDSGVEVPPHDTDNGRAGEATGSATATDIGTTGNISSGADLSFSQYDNIYYQATSATAFTGGSQQQVTVVSQDDMDKLAKSQLDSLTQKAKSNLKDSASGRQLADDAITTTVTKKQFDKNLNDEASLLNLNTTVEAKAIVYSDDDLKNIIAQNVNQSSIDNLQARPENIQITKLVSQVKGDKLLLGGEYNADLVPKFNDDDLKSKIVGKTTKGAEAIIKQIPQVSNVQFEFSPKLFIFFTVPTNKAKISFKIESTQ